MPASRRLPTRRNSGPHAISECAKGRAYLALVLHAHLPFVRHPESDVFLEEDWLFEAIIECYLPLLQTLQRLHSDNIPFRLTLSLSPTLLSMLGDDLLRQRFGRHLQQLRKLVDDEVGRTRKDARFNRIALHYRQRLQQIDAVWQQTGGDVPAAFARLQEADYLDLMTTAATHGYLPLLSLQPQAIHAQLQVAVDHHTRVIGRKPTGIWLPECGYLPGLDCQLARCGLRYFVGETHALLYAQPRPRCGAHQPAYCSKSGVAVFGRDPDAAQQVWDRQRGYPGHGDYRDFYRDIGFDLSPEHLGPFIEPDGRRRFTGIKYHRITSLANETKTPYVIDDALHRASEHAGDFLAKRLQRLSVLRTFMPHPIVVAPYDAELFGHWWYEGCEFLEQLIRQWAQLPTAAMELVHLRGYLQHHPTHQVLQPCASSWGEGGYNQYWLDGSNCWIYPHLHQAAERMIALARRFTQPTELQRRALNHAARQLLLAQSSDWAFIMRAGTMTDYAITRTKRHLSSFQRLCDQIEAESIAVAELEQGEQRDNLFAQIDYRVYAD